MWKVSSEKSVGNIMGVPWCYQLAYDSLFSSGFLFSYLWNFLVILIMMGTGVGLFVWDFLCPFYVWMSVSFLLLGNFSAIISAIILANTFSVPFPIFSLSENSIMRIWLCLISFQRFLNQSSFIFFTVLLTYWIIFIILSYNLLVYPSTSPILLLYIPYIYIYIYTHTYIHTYIWYIYEICVYFTHMIYIIQNIYIYVYISCCGGRGPKETDFFHIF